VASREFSILKGTKQGDPISSFIFNAVLEEVMRKVKAKWEAKKYGRQLGPGSNSLLMNLRFADDILLVARTLPQIKQMIADIQSECLKVGLELHPDKTKIQHNNIGYGTAVRKATVGTMIIEVLDAEASNMYLGRALTLTSTQDIEIYYRLKKVWSKFGVNRQELTDKAIPLRLRLKLFHSVVTPTALYGCTSWVMTSTRHTEMKSAQMKMLRAVLGPKRTTNEHGDLETWVVIGCSAPPD
jgi:hypothetical protein